VRKTPAPSKTAAKSAASPAGPLARTLRLRSNVTLERLADETGVSKGHLSRFERGEKSLSIAALMRLSRALNTSVSALLGERAGEDLLHVVHAGDRSRRKAAKGEGDYEFVTLSRSDRAGSPSAFIVHLNVMSTFGKDAFHQGDEMCFVLSGAVEIGLASHSMLLRQGDFAQFPGSIRHRMRGLEPNTAVLIVVTPS
jgi:transcriptional regulator with XRE-family HTH domain